MNTGEPFDDDGPDLAPLDRTTAARRIAAALHRRRHHIVAASHPAAVLPTLDRLAHLPGAHHLDYGNTGLYILTGPIPAGLLDELRQDPPGHAVSLVPASAVTTVVLAGLLDTAPPDASPAVILRRPERFPDTIAPLLAAAQHRLTAYQRHHTPPTPEGPAR